MCFVFFHNMRKQHGKVLNKLQFFIERASEKNKQKKKKEFLNKYHTVWINKWCVLVAWWCHVFQHNVLTKLGRLLPPSFFCSLSKKLKLLQVVWDLLSFFSKRRSSKDEADENLLLPSHKCSLTHNPGLILNFKVLLKIDFYAKQSTPGFNVLIFTVEHKKCFI